MSNEMNNVIFEAEHIRKQFIGCLALDDVSISLRAHEVHAIIGENGAGKSTICKILTGQYQPTEGSLKMFGKPVQFKSTHDSKVKGISMVYQERNLIPHLTGAENIMLGSEPHNGPFMNMKKLRKRAYELRDRLGIDVPLDVPVNTLGAGSQQIIEIIRAFSTEPKVVILDEPTASLGEGEVAPFLEFVKRLKRENDIAIIFISHKLEEVYEVADTISVFTEGRKILTDRSENLTHEDCIRAMLKNNDMAAFDINESVVAHDDVVLEVGSCEYDDAVHNLGIRVYRGEVVGFYGLIGSGRTEFAEAMYGVRPIKNADIKFNGVPIKDFTTSKMIERGMIMTPEKRADAIYPTYSLSNNINVLFLNKTVRKFLGFTNARKEAAVAKKVLGSNKVKFSSPKQEIRELSGGNIQKIVIGRSMNVENVSLMIFDEPTTGLDLGAKHDVYLIARRLAEEERVSSIFISSELNELLSVCNRIYVFAGGNVTEMFTRDAFDKEKILHAAFRRQTSGTAKSGN